MSDARLQWYEGAAGRIVDRSEYTSSDRSHLSAAGRAEVAAVARKALHRRGVLPR